MPFPLVRAGSLDQPAHSLSLLVLLVNWKWVKVRMVFSGLCSGFSTNSFCCSLMLIQRPRRTVFLRVIQTATSFRSNPRSVCISTPISVLKEQLRTSASSTAVCYFNILICDVMCVMYLRCVFKIPWYDKKIKDLIPKQYLLLLKLKIVRTGTWNKS